MGLRYIETSDCLVTICENSRMYHVLSEKRKESNGPCRILQSISRNLLDQEGALECQWFELRRNFFLHWGYVFACLRVDFVLWHGSSFSFSCFFLCFLWNSQKLPWERGTEWWKSFAFRQFFLFLFLFNKNALFMHTVLSVVATYHFLPTACLSSSVLGEPGTFHLSTSFLSTLAFIYLKHDVSTWKLNPPHKGSGALRMLPDIFLTSKGAKPSLTWDFFFAHLSSESRKKLLFDPSPVPEDMSINFGAGSDCKWTFTSHFCTQNFTFCFSNPLALNRMWYINYQNCSRQTWNCHTGTSTSSLAGHTHISFLVGSQFLFSLSSFS